MKQETGLNGSKEARKRNQKEKAVRPMRDTNLLVADLERGGKTHPSTSTQMHALQNYQ